MRNMNWDMYYMLSDSKVRELDEILKQKKKKVEKLITQSEDNGSAELWDDKAKYTQKKV